MRRSKYTADFLRPLVKASNSLSDVIRKLGLKTTGGNHRYISSRIRLAELDISHFHNGTRGKVDALTAETLAPIVATSRSVAAVCIAVGLSPEGRPHRELARRLRELSLDMSRMGSRTYCFDPFIGTQGSSSEQNPGRQGLHLERSSDQRLEHRQASPRAWGRVSLCDLRHRRVVRSAAGPPPRSHQRHPQRSPSRKPLAVVPELPLADGHLLQQGA
jgi:hypothetical protein